MRLYHTRHVQYFILPALTFQPSFTMTGDSYPWSVTVWWLRCGLTLHG